MFHARPHVALSRETVVRLAASNRIRPEREHHYVWFPKHYVDSGSRTKQPHTGAAQKRRRKQSLAGVSVGGATGDKRHKHEHFHHKATEEKQLCRHRDGWLGRGAAAQAPRVVAGREDRPAPHRGYGVFL